jgi:parvulin-like peptidyl-prolyl isomerase
MSDRGSRSKKERASNEKGTHVPKQSEARQRRISRAEKDAKRQKQLRLGVGLAAVAVLAVLIGFATWDYVIKPRQVLATVDGTRIRRDDYWKFRKLELYQQMSQYSQYSQLVSDQQQAQQYQSLAFQAQSQLDAVWGSTDVNDATLQQMVDNQIYVQNLDTFGLSISDDELETWTLNQFAPADVPLIEPTVTPTFVPERAEWATQTAEALMPTSVASPTASASSSTPIGDASPIVENGETPVASPASQTGAGSQASPAASPELPGANGATPIGEASPVVTMEPTPTLSAEQAVSTAESSWAAYQTTVLDQANMSVDDYYRLSARPQLAQQKIRDVLTADIGQTADQVHARHILVATEELAQQLYSDISNGTQDFATVAAQSSTDTATAPNGGDLGWFPRGVMVDVFEETAFNTPAGQVAAPVQSEFGWHIIEVIETQAGRALTEDQISQLQQSTVQNWLSDQQQSMSISSVMAPTPTPASSSFVPPIDAPPVPTESGIPEMTFEAATPEASPIEPTHGTPVASPAASSPEASPMASPPASATLPGTPMASPAASTVAVDVVASPAASPIAAIATSTTVTSTPAASPMATPAASPIASVTAPSVASPEATATVPTSSTPIAVIPAVPGATTAAVVTNATPAPVVPTHKAATPESTAVECDEASPVASPIGSPIASPWASPNASPIASPIASPTACAAD